MSAEFTKPSPLVSPTSTPIVPETLPVAPVESTAPVRVTVRYWALGTPVRFTVHWFGFGPLLSDPVLAVPQLVTGFKKVKTIVHSLLVPPLRHSTPRVPVSA